MDRLISIVSEVGDPRTGGADSFCDRLSCVYTVSILVVFALMITTKQYVGEPIGCWCPTSFSSSNVDYANKVCWTTSTFFLPFDVQQIPKEDDPRRKVSYYQWVSTVMTGEAILFYLPRVLWRFLNSKSGIAVSTITDASIERQRKSDAESADKIMRYMIKHLGRFLLELAKKILLADRCKTCWLRLYGNYLPIIYIFVKLVYIGNAIGQIFLLNSFLGNDYHMYGLDVVRRLTTGQNWTTSERFPRVTLCDFQIRTVGAVHRHIVQCALPMNLLNEIFFLFLWFWFVFVAIVTVISLLMWIGMTLYWPYHVNYIKHRLIAMEKLKKEKGSGENIQKFVKSYLRRDGCFIIQMVAKNSSDLIAAELICGLWDHYKDNKKAITKLFTKDEPTAVLEELNL